MAADKSTKPSGVAERKPGKPRTVTRFFSGLRFRLFLLVLLAILPALFLVVYSAVEQRETAKDEAIKTGFRLVGLAAANQKQQIEATRQLLQTLSQLKEVRPEKRTECEALLTNLLELHPVYANIVAIDANGHAFASAVPTNRNDYREQTVFKEARESLKFVVGEYRVDPVSRRATIDLAQPVRDSEKGLVAVIAASLDLGWVSVMAAKLDLAEGSTLTVVDRHGTVLVRYSLPESHQNFLGQKIQVGSGHGASRMKQGQDFHWVGGGLDKVRRLYTATPLTRTGGLADAYVVLGVPVHVAYAQANRMLGQNLLFLGLVGALALGAAWSGGDFFILRHIRALVAAARRMCAGDLTARSGVGHDPGEVGQLARSFDEMAVSLEQRVQELQVTEAELKALNEELEQRVLDRTMELKRSNEDLEQFAYVASHDLQEPLRMVHNYLQLLRQRYQDKLDDNAKDFIGFALDGATRMHELIQDLLTYSRVGTHGKEFAMVDCREAFDRAVANLSLAIEESGASVTHDPLPIISGDIVQLTQLFQNLIANAIKFRGDRSPEVRIGAERRDAEWDLTVSDNGIGIAEQDFQRIFVVFQRLHSREKYPGTGIGLSVCKKIVERHGGRIWVESRLGRGTTFHIILPAPAGAWNVGDTTPESTGRPELVKV
jgi:signal transduction histidine kinase